MNFSENIVDQDFLRDLFRSQAELETLGQPGVQQLVQQYEEHRVRQPDIEPRLQERVTQLEQQAYRDEFDRRVARYERQMMPDQIDALMETPEIQDFIRGELADPTKESKEVTAEAREMVTPIVQDNIR